MIETTAIPKVNITDLRLCHWIKRLSRNTILRLNETQLLTEDSNVSYNKTRWKHGYDPAQLREGGGEEKFAFAYTRARTNSLRSL